MSESLSKGIQSGSVDSGAQQRELDPPVARHGRRHLKGNGTRVPGDHQTARSAESALFFPKVNPVVYCVRVYYIVSREVACPALLQ